MSNFSKFDFPNYILLTYIQITTTFVSNIKTNLRQPKPLNPTKSYLPQYFYIKKYDNDSYNINTSC